MPIPRCTVSNQGVWGVTFNACGSSAGRGSPMRTTTQVRRQEALLCPWVSGNVLVATLALAQSYSAARWRAGQEKLTSSTQLAHALRVLLRPRGYFLGSMTREQLLRCPWSQMRHGSASFSCGCGALLQRGSVSTCCPLTVLGPLARSPMLHVPHSCP